MTRRYAICNETFGDWPLDKALAFAAAAGFTGWEVAPFVLTDTIGSFSKSERNDYRAAVEAAGLSVVGLHWLLAKTNGLHLTTNDADVRLRTRDYLCDLVELCSDLGGDVMVLGSPQQRNVPEGQSMDQAMQNAAEVLSGVTESLAQHGVKIALEPLGPQEGNFLNTAAEARQLQAIVDHPSIGLHLDVKAMSTEPTPIADVIRANADWMIHFHANDPNLLGPGMGDVDFQPIFAALDDVHYDGWVSVEVFDYSPGIERLVLESMSNMLNAQKQG
ncbi:D-tagatose 3-epimerase [Planctomycetes bacterium CA13]|uniref:D-tagatose 3-epimerase n=1 Tax=Novipirellula herctigrandis TaxID=2527986 RepID=A0A5C5YN65_9BACT|nr:D-tagatose 3-epimerase [Planctomycetes bacterium CA13]